MQLAIDNRSSWKSFGNGLEEVTFTGGQMRLAAVYNNSRGAQSKKNVLGCNRRQSQVAVKRFCLEILVDGKCYSISDYIPINPTKGYEFSIYIKSTVRIRVW